MSRPIITLGCSTSHGGTVVSASQLSDIQGKAIARVGDSVSCPRCSGNLIIVSGDLSMIVDGAAVARDGDKTSCGATLIADQHTTYTLETGFDAFFSSSESSEPQRVVGSPDSVENKNDDDDDDDSDLEQFYEFIDSSGKPVNLSYRIDSPDGKLNEGVLDINGRTAKFPMTKKIELTAWKKPV
jgi:uncharacterized Zn-binding protein involved in type VI secretion